MFGGGGSAYEQGDDTTQAIKRRRVSNMSETCSVVSKGTFAPKSTRLLGLGIIDPLITKIVTERCPPEGVQVVSGDVSQCITVALKEHISRVVESAIKQRTLKVADTSSTQPFMYTFFFISLC